MNKPRIFDCFPFFNELDLLELRLNIMDPYVDFFVLCESKKTFSYKDKPLYYELNKDRFKDFAHRIIHVVTDFKQKNDWGNEFAQRDAIINGLGTCMDNDVIILSDLDEIPNLEGVDFSEIGDQVWDFNQQYYYYYLNMRMGLTQFITKAFTKKTLFDRTNLSIYNIRGVPADRSFEKMGWHFSYMGGTEAIIAKLASFAHQDMNLPQFNNAEALEKRILENKDLFDRSYGFTTVPIDESFPKYIQDNQEKYKHLIRPW